jgi:hypothetical protein
MKQDNLNIGQLVYVINKDMFVRIIDKEYINNMVLYYTDDNLAYSIDQLYYLQKIKTKSSEKINKDVSLVLDEWLTPDNCLKINVNITKRLNRPFINT